VTTSEFVLSVSKSIDLCKLKVDPEWGQRNLFSKRLLGSQNTALNRMENLRHITVNFNLHFILISRLSSFITVLNKQQAATARRIRYLLPCSRRHIPHFFQSLDYKKIIRKQGIHNRFLKE
jgi:hypothetical protein